MTCLETLALICAVLFDKMDFCTSTDVCLRWLGDNINTLKLQILMVVYLT